jgi:hypothetical protein
MEDDHMTTDNLEELEDAEFAEAEQQLRLWGFGHIEREDEKWWFDLVYVLRRYYDEHLDYPTKDELRELWRQEVGARVNRGREILARTLQ